MTLLFDILDIMRRRRRLLLAFCVVFVLVASAAIYLKRPAYESVAKILVNFEGRGVSLSRADVQYNTTSVQAAEAIASQVEVLRSNALDQEVIDRLGADTFRDPPPTSSPMRLVLGAIHVVQAQARAVLVGARLVEPVDEREAMLAEFERALQVFPVRQTQVIAVSFRWHNSRLPRLVLATVISLYQAKAALLNGQLDGYDLFLAQAQRASKDLDKSDRELRDLTLQHNVTDLKREKALLIERIERLSPIADQAGAARTEGAGQESESNLMTQLRSQLNGLTVDRAKLLATFTPESRPVQELDRQIAAVEAALQREQRTLADVLNAAKERLRALQQIESDVNRLARNLEIATDAYQTYRKASEDRRVMKAQEVLVHLQVIDPPSEPLHVGPSRLMQLLAAIAAAVALTPGVAFLVDWIARTRASRAAPDPVRPGSGVRESLSVPDLRQEPHPRPATGG